MLIFALYNVVMNLIQASYKHNQMTCDWSAVSFCGVLVRGKLLLTPQEAVADLTCLWLTIATLYGCCGQHGVYGYSQQCNNTWHVLICVLYSNNRQVRKRFKSLGLPPSLPHNWCTHPPLNYNIQERMENNNKNNLRQQQEQLETTRTT